MGILQYNTKRMTQIILFDLIDIDAVISYLSICNIIKTIDQIGNRCFACSGGTDKSNFLPRCRKHINVMQNGFFRKIHIIKNDITFQLHIGCAAVLLVKMFPCPHTGSFTTFHNLSIFFSGINKCNITVIFFRFFIQKSKYTLCSRHSHNNKVQLLTHLHNRHIQTLIKGQKTCQTTKGKATKSTDCKNTSHNSNDDVTHISNLRICRS